MTADRDIRVGQEWAIEAPDNRATWRQVRVIALTTRNKAVVEMLSGPRKGDQIKVGIETFIEEMKKELA